MATSSSTPETVDLEGYAGDTLTRRVTISGDATGFVAGREWSAQVRSVEGGAIEAEFVIVPDATGATITLTGADTASLVAGSAAARRRQPGQVGPQTVTGGVYTGVWDVQLAPAGGGDPTTTLVRGSIKITSDVTRP